MTADRPTTIVVDASDIDRPSGGRTAVLDLFRTLFARQPDWRYVVLVSQREPDFAQFPYVRQIVVPVRNRLLERAWVQIAVGWLAWVKRADLVHFARSMGGFTGPAKNVQTVFDLTTLRHPELHSRSAVWFWHHVQPAFLRRADRVIAISRDVAHDLEREFRLSPDKIEVVYCAPKSIFQQPTQAASPGDIARRYGLPERYILFVGMLAKKKNLSTLIQALHLLKQRGVEPPNLVIAGRRYRQSDDVAIFQQIHALGLESDVQYIGPVEDEELPGLYRGAEVFVFPSLHEGFGIPCLEAMACRVPVVAARSGAVPEVVGDAALLVEDATDAQAFAQAIHQVLSDPSLRQELMARGSGRAERFSWPGLADQVLALYHRLLEA
jgi:glycosyltransferase involved in cell wall biosynthesis